MSPSAATYRNYRRAVGTAPNEQTVLVGVAQGLLRGCDDGGDEGYDRVCNQAFTAFPKEVGFNNQLATLWGQQFSPVPVEDQVSGGVLTGGNLRSLALLHLAGEFKGPGKNMKTARLQSAYGGAALVYGRDPRGTRPLRPSPPTAKPSTFPLFRPVHGWDRDRVSHTNPLNSFEKFKQGLSQLRNLEDYAKDPSYGLRDRLKGPRYRGLCGATAGKMLGSIPHDRRMATPQPGPNPDPRPRNPRPPRCDSEPPRPVPPPPRPRRRAVCLP